MLIDRSGRPLWMALCALGMSLGGALAQPAPLILDNQAIDRIRGPTSDGCVLFSLRGRPVADSLVSSTSPFFAMPVNRPNFNEHYALLLAAAASQNRVLIQSTRTAVCGNAGMLVLHLVIPPPPPPPDPDPDPGGGGG